MMVMGGAKPGGWASISHKAWRRAEAYGNGELPGAFGRWKPWAGLLKPGKNSLG